MEKKYSYYTDGNTVRKIAEVPERREQRQPRTYVDNKRVKANSVTYRNREKALSMNGGYVAFLAVAAIVSVMLCVNYLKLQTEITEKTNSIKAVQQSIDTLTSQNDSLDYTVNSYIDLDNIYKIATEELGMVRATKDQVQLYNKSENEYMKQYSDIPKE